MHAIGKIDKETGKSLSEKPSIPLYQDVFGETMVELCKQNENIIAITAAMCKGARFDKLKDVMPERVIDVGIAKGHAVTFHRISHSGHYQL